jgi:predicted amidohydrolase YtcJ
VIDNVVIDNVVIDNAAGPITVFTARRVRTMERSQPVAEAVAVRDGHVLEVGSLATMKPWLDRYPHTVDDRFAEHVIMPGFIDPHLHPSMAAMLPPQKSFSTG